MVEIARMLPNGPVELREQLEDGTKHRFIRTPGQEVRDLPDDVRRAIETHWTPERVAAYEAASLEQLFDSRAPSPRLSYLEQLETTVRELDARLTALEARGSQ